MTNDRRYRVSVDDLDYEDFKELLEFIDQHQAKLGSVEASVVFPMIHRQETTE